MHERAPNRWKGFVLGAIGGGAGVMAMTYYWKAASALAGGDPRKAQGDLGTHALDHISLVGAHHQEGESTTAAAGRILYRQATGKEPEAQETKTTLSYLVHWALSMGMSGLYGATRGRADVPDVTGGLALAVGLWLFGDELGVALLGLAKGPTAFPPVLHANSLGAHVAYGLASAATTQVLHRLT
jgi:hypothetical protein